MTKLSKNKIGRFDSGILRQQNGPSLRMKLCSEGGGSSRQIRPAGLEGYQEKRGGALVCTKDEGKKTYIRSRARGRDVSKIDSTTQAYTKKVGQ